MTVLHRDALEASPLADLHAIASELGIDGFRRLRKAELIDRILRDSDSDSDADDNGATVAEEVVDEAAAEEDARPKRRRGSRGGRGRSRDDADRDDRDADEPDEGPERRDETIEGVVELLGNGSGFVRVSPPEPSDGDVYISAAQVRRCELVSGDRVSGPVRKPRRSERYPSLVRVDTINGAPAEEVAEGTPYDELPCAFPSVRLELGSDDPTLKAIEWLTPIGRGSRVVITGGALAGKTETLRRLATALAGVEGLDLSLVLTGVRPEEAADWKGGPVAPASSLTLAAGSDAQGQALERAIEATRSSSSTRSTASHRPWLAGRWPRRAPSSTAGRSPSSQRPPRRWAARRRSSASTPPAPRRATSRRSTCGPAGSCVPSCWSATRALTRSRPRAPRPTSLSGAGRRPGPRRARAPARRARRRGRAGCSGTRAPRARSARRARLP
jgi:Rho termination factor, RNA-binding domain/Rho termination factor, N-terminal domain